MNIKKEWLILLALFFISLISFSLDKYSQNIFTQIENPFLDGFFILITNIGLPLVLAIIILLTMPFTKKRKETYLLLFTILFASSITLAIKSFFMRERPDDILVSLVAFLNYSFPSMHTTIAFAILPLVNCFFEKKKWLFTMLAALIAVSRLYLRVHYLSDVMFGAFIGYLLGNIMLSFKDDVFFTNPFRFSRQIIHAILGIMLSLLIYLELFPNIIIIPVILLGLALTFICLKTRVPVISWLLEKLERKQDLEKFPGKGVVNYFVGALFVANLFPKDIAAASIMILALGDPISNIIGRYYGRTKHNLKYSKQKYVEGTIFAIFAAFTGAVLFIKPLEAILASIIAMIIEAVEIKIRHISVDDNLIIPLISGSVIFMVRYLVG